MVRVPAGSFVMGSPGDEAERGDDEVQHQVTLSRSFWIGKTEVTQGLWLSLMGSNPSKFYGDAQPVERVSWCDAVAFANRLSVREGLPAAYGGVDQCKTSKGDSVVWDRSSVGYRLPTEAEWEYAARGGRGHAYAGAGEAGAVAWTNANAGGVTHPVGQKAANGYGLHDMSGNVFEWCWDRYGDYGGASTDPTGSSSGPSRVIRGGAWFDDPRGARVADRSRSGPGIGVYYLGLRLVRTIP
jgi:formylglycine-generating enzyme required for sulfatase activity